MHRCNIPVILMGETGCGKTRLIKYLCELLSLNSPESSTLAIMKVISLLRLWDAAFPKEYGFWKHTLEKLPFTLAYHFMQPNDSLICTHYTVFLPQEIKRLVYATHISLRVFIVGQTLLPKIAIVD